MDEEVLVQCKRMWNNDTFTNRRNVCRMLRKNKECS